MSLAGLVGEWWTNIICSVRDLEYQMNIIPRKRGGKNILDRLAWRLWRVSLSPT